MIESLFPPGIEPFWALFLVAFSAVTSFTTAAAGIGGGTILVAVIAVIVPVSALIPVHGAVQVGSNAGRTAILLPHVDRSVLLPFLGGSLVGALVGGFTVVQLPEAILKIGLGLFILWTAWGPTLGLKGNLVIVGTGVVSSFLTMFFGATASFIAAMLKTLKLGRMEHVATQGACMVAQHVIKVIVFGFLGFEFTPYLGLILAMIASGFIGTLIGKHVLLKSNDTRFHRILSVVLTLLALRLLYDGLMKL